MIILSPKEFFKIHRQNIERVLLRRNQNILAFFSNSCQRPRFKVVISTVFQQSLQCLPGCRKELNLIQDNELFTPKEFCFVNQLQRLKEGIKVK